jgi:predicted Zn-ribbon and HTH transcriptional regulator
MTIEIRTHTKDGKLLIFARHCQSCGYIQRAHKPKDGTLTKSYLSTKCHKCKSEDLDYGHSAHILDPNGKVIRAPYDEDEESY